MNQVRDLRKKTVKSVAIGEKVYGQWGDLKYYPAVVKNVQTLVYYDSIIEHKQIEKVRKIHQIFFVIKKKMKYTLEGK